MLAFFARKLAAEAARELKVEIRDARNPSPQCQESIHSKKNEGQRIGISLALLNIVDLLKHPL